jgi:uncharacterized Zn finger protein
MLKVITVNIEGSSGTPYIVSIIREEDSLKTSCTCPAGEMRTHCKHRIELFAGNLASVRGTTEPNLAQEISIMLKGTAVESALQAVEAAEIEAKAAKDKVKRAKRALDRVMH